MEGSRTGNKRKRVYCVEAKKVAESAFTRNYVNYLIPALTNSSSSDFKNVRHQVDMAMALSAQGFAWSHRLKLNLLQTDDIHDHHAKVPTTVEASSSSSSKNRRQTDEKASSNDNPSSLEVIEEEEEDEDEDEKMKSQMSSLRKLIPGGEKIVDEEMVTELESYISCLQMQDGPELGLIDGKGSKQRRRLPRGETRTRKIEERRRQ
ncbi:hypothetical protein PIB30_001263 [Stylosanthes scabra]|uniref:IBH1-like N-terminal domain-containing protein n=1 Tax=Stylosanthes scabra TaxID=79078 RepID=A0ABU6X2T0_9FABA|nr:hypothetical protein [Stylosanthes scabra]